MAMEFPIPPASSEPGPEEPIPAEPLPPEQPLPEMVMPEPTPSSAEPAPVPSNPPPVETIPLPPTPGVHIPTHLSISEEHTWAMLAHLSVLLNLITGFLGPVAALAIYFAYKDRSRYVAYQSLQAALFQLIGWVGGGALIGLIWAFTAILIPLLIGLACIPFAILATIFLAMVPLATVAYGVYGAIETSQGQDFQYWLVGDWLRGTLLGS